jgi:hypothetical protein
VQRFGIVVRRSHRCLAGLDIHHLEDFSKLAAGKLDLEQLELLVIVKRASGEVGYTAFALAGVKVIYKDELASPLAPLRTQTTRPATVHRTKQHARLL